MPLTHITFFEKLLQSLADQCKTPKDVRHNITLDDEDNICIWLHRSKKFYPVGLDKEDCKKKPDVLAGEIIKVVDDVIAKNGEAPHDEIEYTVIALSLDGTAVLIGPDGSARDGVDFIRSVRKLGIFAQHGDDVIYFPMTSIKSLVVTETRKVTGMQKDITDGKEEGKTIMQILPDVV